MQPPTELRGGRACYVDIGFLVARIRRDMRVAAGSEVGIALGGLVAGQRFWSEGCGATVKAQQHRVSRLADNTSVVTGACEVPE